MEKERNGKIIAVIALVVAVAGLSLGFAAFSTSLKIDTAANVSNNSNWDVGFSTDGQAIEDVTTPGTKNANESGNPGVIDVTKYTISQHTNANLSTTTGSSVSYDLDILNKGKIAANLSFVNLNNVTFTCTNATGDSLYEGVAGAGSTSSGNTTTISNENCGKMFGVSLKINNTTYSSSASNITGETIAANGSVPVKLTVYYKDDADARSVASTLDGNIIVNIGSISVGYVSAAASGN